LARRPSMRTESGAGGFEAWAQSLHAEYDAFLRQSWAALQAARKGHWIADTEEHVRQAGAVFRQQALEKLLQAQVAAEQGAFSPSAGGLGQQGSADGHAPDGRGGGDGAAAGVAAARRRAGGAGG